MLCSPLTLPSFVGHQPKAKGEIEGNSYLKPVLLGNNFPAFHRYQKSEMSGFDKSIHKSIHMSAQ